MLIEEAEFKRRFLARFKARAASFGDYPEDEEALPAARRGWDEYRMDEGAAAPEWYAERAAWLEYANAGGPQEPPTQLARPRGFAFKLAAAVFGASLGAFATAVLLTVAGPNAWEWLGPIAAAGLILIVGGGVIAGIAFAEREDAE